MYNTGTYNNILYGNKAKGINFDSLPVDDVHFNGFGLNNEFIIITDLLKDGLPVRDFQTYPNPNRDGETSFQDLFRTKTIKINGWIIRETVADLESFLVSFMQKIAQAEKYLYISRGGLTIRWKATAVSRVIVNRESYHLEYIPFEIDFLCLDFGEAVSVTSDFQSETTASQFDILISNDGIHQTYLESIILVNDADTLTQIQIDNITNGTTAIVNGTFTAGDYITFDGKTEKQTDGTIVGRRVLQNTTELYHSGNIPVLDIGNNLIRYTINSVSHSLNVTTQTRLKY